MDFSVLRNKNRIIWSQDQINYIINDYSSNLSTTKLAKEFNVTTQTIRKILQENNRLDRKYNSYIDFIKYMGLDGEPINIGCNESC